MNLKRLRLGQRLKRLIEGSALQQFDVLFMKQCGLFVRCMCLTLFYLSMMMSPVVMAATLERVLQTGDIIFHQSTSQQSLAIQKATKSPYSHMGLVVKKAEQWWVLEAIQPVQYTPLQTWIKRGEKSHVVVKRLKKSDLSDQQKYKLIQHAARYLGKPYDIYFEWDNRAIYCSEIVWKAYHDALGIQLSAKEQLKQFDLTAPEVKALIQQRYGENIPMNETVVSPKAIYDSPLLKEVYRMY